MKPSKSTPTVPLDRTSSQTAPAPNSPPSYDPKEDPDDVATQALIRGLRELRKEREAEKK
jgi:hypothetical protein